MNGLTTPQRRARLTERIAFLELPAGDLFCHRLHDLHLSRHRHQGEPDCVYDEAAVCERGVSEPGAGDTLRLRLRREKDDVRRPRLPRNGRRNIRPQRSSRATVAYSAGGIWPCIVGTALLVIGSMVVALLIGISSAIYLSEYSRNGRWIRLIRIAILNLAGVPSIVFGLFGFGLFVIFFIGTFRSSRAGLRLD